MKVTVHWQGGWQLRRGKVPLQNEPDKHLTLLFVGPVLIMLEPRRNGD